MTEAAPILAGCGGVMPVYFAYGSNLDRNAMAKRCPRSTPLSIGRLADHRFFITADGYASIRREQRAVVHGLLWMLAPGDIAALDRYEDVDGGLYTKVTLPILKSVGSSPALVYVARSETIGTPKRGYMESIVAEADSLGLPDEYRRELRQWLLDRSVVQRDRSPAVVGKPPSAVRVDR